MRKIYPRAEKAYENIEKDWEINTEGFTAIKLEETHNNLSNTYVFIVQKFVKNATTIAETSFWTRERLAAKKLINKYGFSNLLLVNLSFKLNSLSWFFSFDGAKEISRQLNMIKLDNKPKIEYKLEESKIEKDLSDKTTTAQQKKKNNLMEFLK